MGFKVVKTALQTMTIKNAFSNLLTLFVHDIALSVMLLPAAPLMSVSEYMLCSVSAMHYLCIICAVFVRVPGQALRRVV